jgi:hypothetical protein
MSRFKLMTQEKLIVQVLAGIDAFCGAGTRLEIFDPHGGLLNTFSDLRPKRTPVAPVSQINMEGSLGAEDAMCSVHTYHCICHTLVLAIRKTLESLPTRASSKDGARILSPFSEPQIVHVVEERKAMIVRREDGFEKRTLLRCERCRLVVAYKLDGDHFEDASRELGQETLYVLPGALVDTEGMMAEKTPEVPAWARETG